GALGAWLRAIAKNIARQRLRTRSRHPESALPPDAVDRAQQQALDAVEETLLVRDALTRLEAPCGEVLRRFFVMEQKYGEIAAAMQIPAGTVASRIARCLVRLRRVMAGPENPAGRNQYPPASV
ncbi:MAG TPA: sigma-70 family RNA polymerase sigma factor, partial [bacterium]